MQMREIPQEQWTRFFEECSERHRGESVTIEAMAGTFDAVQSDAYQLPLVQIADVRSDGGEKIDVVAGAPDAVHHVIHSPTRVQVTDQQDGGQATIIIAASDGRTTRVKFGQCQDNRPEGTLCQ